MLTATRQASGLSMAFTAQLREARQAKGLSQKQLAEKAGISGAMVSHTENGHRNLSWGTAEKILAALGAHVSVEVHPGVCPHCGCCPKCKGEPQ